MPNTRLIQANQVVLDQVDFLAVDGFTRITGLTIADLTCLVFFNNSAQPWPLTSGSSVLDNQVASGRIYFHEIPGSPGFYSLRFRPNAVGFWRVLVSYPVGTQTSAQDYDVSAQTQTDAASGVKSSFTRPT